MRKLTISEFAYPDPHFTGVGERNTVSSGRDVKPEDHANDQLASSFVNCMRHDTTIKAVDDMLTAVGQGINIGGHGDVGFLETGAGQGGPFPDGQCIHSYNQVSWGPQLDRIANAAIVTISIWSCHVGAEDDGADLLYAMAKRAQHAVRAGTGYLFSDAQGKHWQNGSVWQVATPTSRPAPITRPPGNTIVARAQHPRVIPTPNGSFRLDEIAEVRVEAVASNRSFTAGIREISGQAAAEFVGHLFVGSPMDFRGISVTALATATIVVRSTGGDEVTFTVLNGGLAIDRATDTGFYLSRDPMAMVYRR